MPRQSGVMRGWGSGCVGDSVADGLGWGVFALCLVCVWSCPRVVFHGPSGGVVACRGRDGRALRRPGAGDRVARLVRRPLGGGVFFDGVPARLPSASARSPSTSRPRQATTPPDCGIFNPRPLRPSGFLPLRCAALGDGRDGRARRSAARGGRTSAYMLGCAAGAGCASGAGCAAVGAMAAVCKFGDQRRGRSVGHAISLVTVARWTRKRSRGPAGRGFAGMADLSAPTAVH
jgi:hypothetical protein